MYVIALDVNTYNANKALDTAPFVHTYLTPLWYARMYIYVCCLLVCCYSIVLRVQKHHSQFLLKVHHSWLTDDVATL